MIVSVGIDMLEISRMAKMLAKHSEAFCRRVLSEDELTLYKNLNSQLIAKLFTAKEAFVKALGTGFREGISLQNISIIDDNIFYPAVAKEILAKKNVTQVMLSCMTTDDYAISMVVCER